MKKYIVSFLMLCGLSSVAFASDCARSVDETVSCSDSGLMWQDNSDANTTEKNWQDAISYCENLTFVGHSDWRLPNRNELKSIVDYTKHNPAIKNGFTNTISNGYYWTSTTATSNTSTAWGLIFNIGSGGLSRIVDAKSNLGYVRCVRAGQ